MQGGNRTLIRVHLDSLRWTTALNWEQSSLSVQILPEYRIFGRVVPRSSWTISKGPQIQNYEKPCYQATWIKRGIKTSIYSDCTWQDVDCELEQFHGGDWWRFMNADKKTDWERPSECFSTVERCRRWGWRVWNNGLGEDSLLIQKLLLTGEYFKHYCCEGRKLQTIDREGGGEVWCK